MIGSLRGEVIEKGEGCLLLDVNGVGYIVNTPAPVLDQVEVGSQLFVRTFLHVRENALTLFGFTEAEALEMFEALLSVQGIGPKVALAIQSHLSNETIQQAVARGEAAILARVPGIGPKKAKQIAFQLKGKITFDEIFSEPVPISDDDGEVIAALTTLGYSIVEAQAALQNLPQSAKEEGVEEKIRLALSSMAKL
jgi:Holliday junction DNA helicase RuvA